jgi:ADP-ribose pyrophosphatase
MQDMDQRSATTRETALTRYAMMREQCPEMFGDGPMPIIDPSTSRHAGVAYVDPWIMLVVDAVRLPDGRTGDYTRLRYAAPRGAGVAVLPVTSTGVVLLRQWRHATQSWHLEIPRGFGEPDVPVIDQAGAELVEETGLTADLAPLGTLHPDTGTLSFEVELFVAMVHPGQAPVPENALSTIMELPFAAFERAMAEGGITDSFTLAAWLRWRLRTNDIR